MKKIIIAGCLVISFVFSAAAQQPNAKNEKQELTDRIFALYQKGDFEEAIGLGEKLVKMEKAASGGSASYVNALINLARLKRAYFTALQNRLRAGDLSASERGAMSDKAHRGADEAEEMFREALAVNEQNGRGKTAQTADIKKDLAWMVWNRTYAGKKTIDKTRSRIDEAEKLLLDAAALSEQTRSRDADETLLIALEAGDFYYKYVNFEKALPFYERFIQTFGQKHGANHPALVGALRPYAAILFATFQDAEAAAAIKRIEAITGKTEPEPKIGIDLHLRSKDAVAYTAPILMDQNERSQTYVNRRLTQGSVNVSQVPGLISVPVAVEIDETGKIVKAAADTKDEKLKAEAEALVAKWTVRPFSYNGTNRKLRGTLIYRKPR